GVVRWVEALEPSSRGMRVQYAAGQRTPSVAFPCSSRLLPISCQSRASMRAIALAAFGSAALLSIPVVIAFLPTQSTRASLFQEAHAGAPRPSDSSSRHV